MRKHSKMKLSALMGALIATLMSTGANAQSAPAPVDAGRSLDALKQMPKPLPAGKELELPADIRSQVAKGGQQVRIKSLRFSGNDNLSTEELLGLLRGRASWETPLDLAALRRLADTVTDVYRASGFPFARAFLLAGSLKGEELTITVVEGRYGEVVALNDDEKIARAAQSFLSRLQPGQPIRSAEIERATLLLQDVPGVSVTPVMRPGQQVGSGDLNVVVETGRRVSGGLYLDNQGSYYSGEYRALGSLRINRALVFGDELSVTAQVPLEGSSLADVNYAFPLGANGTRIKLGKARTTYDLKGEFKGFSGTAVEDSVTVSHPWVRSRKGNLTLALSGKYKELFDDRQGDVVTRQVQSTPLVINFDYRDDWGPGGLTYGSLSLVRGEVSVAGVRNKFLKWGADVARVQRLDPSWNLYARVLMQDAADNLDSAEGITLGGASGVRAYPTGEASGDVAWLMQLEVRRAVGGAQAYAFYDHGEVQIDARPELVANPSPNGVRAGAGVGIRGASGAVNFDLALAWRTRGGAPTTTGGTDPKPRLWFVLSHAL